MEQLTAFIEQIAAENPLKLIVSNPLPCAEYKKIVLTRKADIYQAEKFTEKQVFHQSITPDKLVSALSDWLNATYLQLNSFHDGFEYNLRITKKRKVFLTKCQSASPVPVSEEHNRKKHYLFEEGQHIEPLIDMGVFTKDGKVVRSMYDKYKQINRFIELIDDAVRDSGLTELTVIDFGCGKSYLTFLLYYYFVHIKNIKVKMIGLDLKEEVIASCNEVAKKYGYSDLTFQMGNIETFHADFPVDMVITLHACDTATDYALLHAVLWKARLIFSVPCCQHELNRQIESDRLSILTRYGIIKERIAAEMTDAIRANLLQCCGYKTQLLEFIDFSHTPKNLMIRAVKAPMSPSAKAKAFDEVTNLQSEFHLKPTLLTLLQNEGLL